MNIFDFLIFNFLKELRSPSAVNLSGIKSTDRFNLFNDLAVSDPMVAIFKFPSFLISLLIFRNSSKKISTPLTLVKTNHS